MHEKIYTFDFMHCWPIVKNHRKFFDIEKMATPKLRKRKSRLQDIPSTSTGVFETKIAPTSLDNISPLPSTPTKGILFQRG